MIKKDIKFKYFIKLPLILQSHANLSLCVPTATFILPLAIIVCLQFIFTTGLQNVQEKCHKFQLTQSV